MLYTLDAIALWLCGRIRWSTLRMALRERPDAVCGIYGNEIIDRDAAFNFFGK